jgi:Kef-type K+ transport system membrane component KefB
MESHFDVLTQIAIAIVAATTFGFIARLLRQPLILGYIVAGVVIGPTQGFGWIDAHTVEPIAHLGLILLLFMIGLEIDLKKIQRSGRVVVTVGTLQVLLCVLFGLLALPLLGLTREGGFSALYLSIAAALASTMIVVKLLYDKRELDTLPGQITLGILVFQDLWAVLFLAIQRDLNNPQIALVVLSLVKVIGVVAFALLMSKYALPVLFRSMAQLPELLVIGALAWCFLVTLVCEQLGLSKEMGALIAGVALSTFPYNLDVIAKVISLRDFFITLFFVTLGAQVPRPTPELIGSALLLSGFLFASRFVSIYPVLYALRQGNRVSLLPAINLSQISEFSLVICTLGVALGHITQGVLSVVVLVLLITSVTSTYALLYNYSIFERINPLLLRLGLKDLDAEKTVGATVVPSRDLIFLGFHRSASSLLHDLQSLEPTIMHQIGIVDFNPVVKRELDRHGIPAMYGDISHLDTLHHADIHDAHVLICTLPDGILQGTSNLRLLRQLKSIARGARIIVTSETLDGARELYQEGAAFVFVPRLMSTRDLALVVAKAMYEDPYQDRVRAIQQVEDRTEVLR